MTTDNGTQSLDDLDVFISDANASLAAAEKTIADATAVVAAAPPEAVAQAVAETATCYLVIDTETSKLPIYKRDDGTPKPADDPDQPRLAHLAMIYVNEHLDVTKVADIYVKPDGWSLDPEAAAVNGLTDEFLAEAGRPIAEALDLYEAALAEGRVIIAHNAQFDCKIMRGELRRAGRDDHFEKTPNACTMRSSMTVCGLKSANGRAKWPTLTELCQHFGIEYERAHRAPNDALACYKAFVRLMKMGVLQVPRVHYAKNYSAT